MLFAHAGDAQLSLAASPPFLSLSVLIVAWVSFIYWANAAYPDRKR